MKILVAQSFGHRGDDPGLSNRFMARKIAGRAEEFDRLEVQHEIGSALRLTGVTPDFEVGPKVPGGYLTTLEVIQRILTDLWIAGIDPRDAEIWMACHHTHWRYCKWILQSYEIRPKRFLRRVPYDPLSHQWWTRNAVFSFTEKVRRSVAYLITGKLRLKVLGITIPPWGKK